MGDFTVSNKQSVQQTVEKKLPIKKDVFIKDELEAVFKKLKNKKAPTVDKTPSVVLKKYTFQWYPTFVCPHKNKILYYTAQKMHFSIKDFFSKCDQIRREMQIWPYLLKKSLIEKCILCAVLITNYRRITLTPLLQRYTIQYYLIIFNYNSKRLKVYRWLQKKHNISQISTMRKAIQGVKVISLKAVPS